MILNGMQRKWGWIARNGIANKLKTLKLVSLESILSLNKDFSTLHDIFFFANSLLDILNLDNNNQAF
jgi:hypothetical protein